MLCAFVQESAAQTSVPASPYAPGVELQQTFPGKTPMRMPDTPPRNPFPQSDGRPVQIPQQSGVVEKVEKVVNVDTALAALMSSIGNFSANGTMELWTTNSGKLDVKRFPFIMVVKDGRIRTELDLRYIETETSGEENMFTTLRQVGIHRISTITLPQLTTVQILFPHAKTYLTQGLSFEDIPGVMRFTKKLFGPMQLDKQVYDKFDVVLQYNTGDTVPMEVWEIPGKTGEPTYVKFIRDQSAVTVHFASIRKSSVADNLFKVPEGFEKYSDLGVMLQAVSIRFERQRAETMPGGARPRTSPLVVQPNPDGSFQRQPR